jgi:hypothetical protein
MVNATSGPYGKLEDYSFPTDVVAGAENPWSMTVHNAGGAQGNVGAVIGNDDSNPDKILVTYAGKTFELAPGYCLILYKTMAPCERVSVSGTVKFPSAGKYKILVGGVHQEGDRWLLDDGRWLNG